MKHSKETIDVMTAALAIAARDIELGLVDIEQIQSIPRTRFAPVERTKLVQMLKAEGLTNKKIAKTLKVSEHTVAEDLGKPKSPSRVARNAMLREATRTKNSMSTPHANDYSVHDDTDSVPDEIKQEAIRDNFLVLADRAAAFAAYRGPVDEEVRRAVTRAAMAWNDLAKELGR